VQAGRAAGGASSLQLRMLEQGPGHGIPMMSRNTGACVGCYTAAVLLLCCCCNVWWGRTTAHMRLATGFGKLRLPRLAFRQVQLQVHRVLCCMHACIAPASPRPHAACLERPKQALQLCACVQSICICRMTHFQGSYNACGPEHAWSGQSSAVAYPPWWLLTCVCVGSIVLRGIRS
jgi:hypothetical protein